MGRLSTSIRCASGVERGNWNPEAANTAIDFVLHLAHLRIIDLLV